MIIIFYPEEPRNNCAIPDVSVSLPLNFWKRLESFVSDVQTGCCMGEEEKEMILHVCKTKGNER
jgi:hypothetical protein